MFRTTLPFFIIITYTCVLFACGVSSRNITSENASSAPEGFVLISAGSFIMGSPGNESERSNNEGPQHEVTISRSFYMQIHEVTQGEWEALMGNNPSYFSFSDDGANCGSDCPVDNVNWWEAFSDDGANCGSDCPVDNVNWWEALAYANALSNSEGLQECYVLSGCRNSAGNDMECTGVSLNSDCGYRLPTEAEWEYAARAGTRTAYYNGERTPDDIAWYGEELASGSIHRVGQLEANSWGLYDMSGNVWEWCWDWYETFYDPLSVTDPIGPDSGSDRVLRGGSWYGSPLFARSASRSSDGPNYRLRGVGFRLLTLDDFVLELLDATLTITSNVSDASIIVDGQQINTTISGMPIQVEISPNSSELEVQRDGYITWRQTLNLAPEKNEVFNIELVLISERTTPEGFVLIPAGSFMMGSPSNETGRQDHEGPQHEVTISRSFYIQTHEVTQGEWKALMGNNPSYFSSSGNGASCGSDCPVERVNWWEALAYANALSNSEGLQECYVLSGCRNSVGNDMECTGVSLNSDCGYRLPTEAEWEYAARANTTTAYYNGERTPDDIAWYDENSGSSTHRVGQLEANSWGLYDMSGNVYEWCWDWYGSYGSSSVTDPMGADSGSYRVLRGGSRGHSASNARSAYRDYDVLGYRPSSLGFRLVSSAP